MIGKAIYIIRQFHCLTQTELAHQAQLSRSYLCEIEKGYKSPSLDTLESLAKVFDMPVSSLMFFNENLDNPVKLSKKFKKYSAEKILEYLERSTTHD